MKNLLYLGNKLSNHGFNKTTIETLGAALEDEGFKIIYSSSKKNQILRLLDLVFTTIINAKKVDFILIDTYSTSSFWYAFFCSQIARIFQTKYIPILHGGNLPNRLKSSPTFSKMLFKHAYKNVAPSNYLKSVFEKAGYTNLVYIPNTIALEKYAFKKREIFEPKILWVRAFASIYNPNMAIYVLQEVQKTYPNATLTMVGPDKDGSLLKAKELAHKLKITVNFTGQLPKEEWWEVAKNNAIFINTTHLDNTPVSVIEAMALGLPVVSTNVGGLPYLVKEKEEAILVNDNDFLQMATEICTLITNANSTKSMVIAARRKVETMDWNVIKCIWSNLFNS